MKERPILFSGPMVRAILDGRKTMTRRVVNPQPTSGAYVLARCMSTTGSKRNEGRLHWIKLDGLNVTDGAGAYFDCPYGQPGHRLWVRETFGTEWRSMRPTEGDAIYYAADGEFKTVERWRPSIHMPRWASRIKLEVVAVRVERVQDISEADAKAEGCDDKGHMCARQRFEILWDNINAARGFGWSVNPWVWVVEFLRVAQ